MDLTLTNGHHAMDWLTFIASIVRAVAWPAAAVTLGYLFRDHITKLLDRLTRLKFPGGQADFSEGLARVERAVRLDRIQSSPNAPNAAPTPVFAFDSAAGISDHPQPVTEPQPTGSHTHAGDEFAKGRPRPPVADDRFDKLVAISPEAAIAAAWLPVENLVDELAPADVGAGNESTYYSFLKQLDRLILAGTISEQQADILVQLRELRNSAHHTQNLTVTDAYRFKKLSDDVFFDLESKLLFSVGRIPQEPT